MQKPRGVTLTIFALLFVLLAISNFSKPFSHDPGIGFVCLGVRQSGTPNAILGTLFGIGLLIFAYGIWTMRHYAMPRGIHFFGVGDHQHDSLPNKEPQPTAGFNCLYDIRDASRHWRAARDGDHSVSPPG